MMVEKQQERKTKGKLVEVWTKRGVSHGLGHGVGHGLPHGLPYGPPYGLPVVIFFKLDSLHCPRFVHTQLVFLVGIL